MPGNVKDMTACFGARNVKTTPKRAFSSCPNRPHRVASVYCQRRVERRGWRAQQSCLASAPSMVSLEREKYLIVVERMIPEGMNYSLRVIL